MWCLGLLAGLLQMMDSDSLEQALRESSDHISNHDYDEVNKKA